MCKHSGDFTARGWLIYDSEIGSRHMQIRIHYSFCTHKSTLVFCLCKCQKTYPKCSFEVRHKLISIFDISLRPNPKSIQAKEKRQKNQKVTFRGNQGNKCSSPKSVILHQSSLSQIRIENCYFLATPLRLPLSSPKKPDYQKRKAFTLITLKKKLKFLSYLRFGGK